MNIKSYIRRLPGYSFFTNVRKEIRFQIAKHSNVKSVINKRYYERFHKNINWEKPIDINEKINWLKLYSDTSLWTKLADKYEVRKYVESKGLGHILLQCYGVWNKSNDIDFASLPASFVLKPTHGWGDVIVVHDKTNMDLKTVKKKLDFSLCHAHGYYTGEPHYKDISRRILAEELLIQNTANPEEALIDYKIWCFDGKPYYIRAYYDRTEFHTMVDTFDTNWNYVKGAAVPSKHYQDGGGSLQKPKVLDELLKVAEILSEGFPQVRVDLYCVNDKVYFGEMTFTSSGGYMDSMSPDFLIHLGSLVNLPNA